MISLKDITVEFDRNGTSTTAVDAVSLDVRAGGIQGIIGFSGAGKSTLLRTINLLQRPTQGQVIVDGVDLTTLTPDQLREARHNIGMIFQHFNLVSNLTARKNVELSLKFAGIDRAVRKKKALEALEIIDLADKADAYPGHLSGGQKQRVAIARALATSPKILLCDEPTSAVDPRTTASILQYLHDINRELGITTVVVTHEMNVIRALAHDVAILENGKLVESLNIDDVLHRGIVPQTEIGSHLLDDEIKLNKTAGLPSIIDDVTVRPVTPAAKEITHA